MFPLPSWVTGKAIQAIAILALLAAITFGIKSWLDDFAETNQNIGIAKENKTWVDRENKRIADQDKKIKDLETAAKEAADKHLKDVEARDSRIAVLDAQLEKEKKRVNTVVYKHDGTVNTDCPADTQIFLGSDFTRLWNNYNKGILQ